MVLPTEHVRSRSWEHWTNALSCTVNLGCWLRNIRNMGIAVRPQILQDDLGISRCWAPFGSTIRLSVLKATSIRIMRCCLMYLRHNVTVNFRINTYTSYPLQGSTIENSLESIHACCGHYFLSQVESDSGRGVVFRCGWVVADSFWEDFLLSWWYMVVLSDGHIFRQMMSVSNLQKKNHALDRCVAIRLYRYEMSLLFESVGLLDNRRFMADLLDNQFGCGCHAITCA